MPRFLYRLLVFTLLLVAVPVVSIGFVSYRIISQDIEQKVNEGNAQILHQNQMRIEQVLKNVEMGAVQYLNSPVVTESLYDGLTHDDFQTIQSLSKGLYNLHSLSGVADTHLINLEKDWMISKLGFTATADFADGGLLERYAASPKNLFWQVADMTGRKAPVSEEVTDRQDIIRLIVKLPMIAPAGKPKALLLIDISKDRLESDLTQNTKLGSLYVMTKDRLPFLSSTGSPSIDAAVITKLQSPSADSGNFEDNGRSVGYRVSSYNGWIYASVNSIDEIMKESRKKAFFTVNVCLIIFAVVAAAAFYGAWRMYAPFRRLFTMLERNGGEAGGAGPRKKDEFAYIEERFDVLFHTGKELQHQLQGQRGQIKEFFLLKLFMGKVTESEFAYKSETYGFGGKGRAMGVLTLQIDTLLDTRFEENDKELLLFAINNMVGELLPPERVMGTLLLDQSQITLVASDLENPEERKAFFHDTAERIKSKVRELLQLQVSIGISRPFYRYTDAERAYTEAVDALKKRIRLGNDIILHYEDMEPNSGQRDPSLTHLNHLEEYLLNALKSGDGAAAGKHFDHYVASIVEREVGFHDFQMLMLQLINRVYFMVSSHNGALYKLTGSKELLKHFIKLNTVADITAWFKRELLPQVITHMSERSESHYLNTAHQMVQMIHDRYDQDITLESCAHELKYHPVYLSRVFKKEMGVTFIDYLTEYRVGMAKKWLENTDMKITEIAAKLNYNNSTGFIRTFRKQTGITPGQYREQHSVSS